MNKPSILKTVSISEMLHLREEGLSNAEIAERIGCSYNTVNRHICKAPFVKHVGRKKYKAPALPDLSKPSTDGHETHVHESFAERCERMRKACEPDTHPLPENNCKTDANLIEEAVLASKDRINEAVKSVIDGFDHCHQTVSNMEPAKLLNLPDGLPKIPDPPILSEHIDELVSVFGKMVVIEYIRCRLYELGMGYCPADREGLLAKLNELRGGVTLD